jgi:hypothetical protein
MFTLWLIARQIASGIMVAWGKTIYGQFGLLAGKSAPHDFLQLLIYKATTFSPDIVKIDTVRAYHNGPVCLVLRSTSRSADSYECQEYFVEIDIIMDAGTALWKAHDIGQQLQDKIEVLPNVERAFVHVDHEASHSPVRLFSSWKSSGHSLWTCRNTGNPNSSFYNLLMSLDDWKRQDLEGSVHYYKRVTSTKLIFYLAHLILTIF